MSAASKSERNFAKSRYKMEDAVKDVESGVVDIKKKPRRPRHSSVVSDLIRFLMKLGMVVAIVVLSFSFVFGVYRVSDPYMDPSVKDGDLVLFYRIDRMYTAGEVAVIRYKDKLTCCRVMAVGGDVVDIDDRGLKINGSYQVIDAEEHGQTSAISDGTTFPLTVPANSVFLLADNRDGGVDSRIFGCLSVDDTEGKMMSLFRRRGL